MLTKQKACNSATTICILLIDAMVNVGDVVVGLVDSILMTSQGLAHLASKLCVCFSSCLHEPNLALIPS